MTSRRFMTTRDFRRLFVGSSLLVSVATVLFISSYLAALLRLSSEQWWRFTVVVAGLFPLFFIATQFSNAKISGPVLAFLRAEEQGASTPEDRCAAFRSVSGLPLWHWYSGLGWWSLGGLAVALSMRLSFETIPTSSLVIICLASSSGGFISATFHYFINKELYHGLLEQLAAVVGQSAERRQYVRRVPLRQKLIVSVTGVSLVTVVFAMLLSLVQAEQSLEVRATRGQLAYLGELARESTEGGRSDVDAWSRRAQRLGIAEQILLVDADSGAVVQGPKNVLAETELSALAASPDGTSVEIASSNAFAWLTLPGEDVIAVASTPWSIVCADLDQSLAVFIGTVLTCGVISLALALFLARDIGSRTQELREAAERLASGDLRVDLLLEAEDELGELSWAFEGMAGALRSTVGRVAEAANLVEATAAEIAGISEKVAGGARDQSSGVQEAVDSMERMNAQAGGIASAAQELNALVEESSSSILEMGAAGDELNDTAGVLSSRVEEVSSSVEQMVRSVEQVNAHTRSLSDVAADTSSSMEEMASSMRQVDLTADEAAGLSKSAVEAAEGGRETVGQTINGMESIRETTASAERVIAGLVGRTKEIGSVLDVIDDVADETNLLALNAAIIAAQAGEHGSAFSVVAEEIKELADRVLASTKEIGDLIGSVQAESDNAIAAIGDGTRTVAQGVDYSRKAGTALEEITRSSRETGQRLHEIVRSVREQSKAAGHVVQMMERVNTGVEAIHGAADEQNRGNEVVYRSTLAMREVAQQLRSTTEEQSRGGTRIRENIDGVRTAVESINEALQSQADACREVMGFLEEASAGSQANDVSSDRLETATRSLLSQAESLREDVRKFVLDS